MPLAARAPMRNFAWQGYDHAQRPVGGELSAATARMVRILLSQQGIRVTKIHQPRTFSWFAPKIQAKDIIFFTRQLATMLQSGILIANGLRALGLSHDKTALPQLIATLRSDIESGLNLSAALAKHPKHFNTLYCSLVAVGETSGTLHRMMTNIADYTEKVAKIKQKIRAALFYPLLVAVVAVVVVALLLLVVIPQFATLFADYGTELPRLTRIVIAISTGMIEGWYWVISGVAISIGGGIFAYRQSATLRYAGAQALLKLPIIGKILSKAIIARIARTLATMFAAGIPLVEALGSVARAAGNRVYARALLAVRTEVTAGQSLEQALAQSGLFPGLVVQMVASGEESGRLDQLLDKVAEFYEGEVDHAVASLASLIEPLLIVVLGIIVGGIVIAMYLPIFQLGSVF